MARITAGIATSHVPAIGAAFDQGRDQDEYWKPVFDAYEWVKAFEEAEQPDVVILCYNDHASALMLDVVPTFALGMAERESRHDIEHERAGVIVVAQDDHVRILALLEILDPVVGVEDGLPVFVPVAALVERRADGRDVAGRDPRGDPRHQFLPRIERCPSGERPPARIIAAYSSGVIVVIELTAFWVVQPSVFDSLTRK